MEIIKHFPALTRKQKYFIKQKLFGLFLIILGVLSCVLTGDGTAMILFLIIGIGVIRTKDMVVMDKYYYETHKTSHTSDCV